MQRELLIPKLDDVAKAAGVSTATVSRCLNSPDQVSKKTLDKVMMTVDRLGYTPNFNARAMAAKRSFTIGAIIPTMENSIFAKGIQAFQEELHENGYTLLVASSAYQPATEKEQIRTLVSRGADALLLIGYDRQPEIYQELENRDIPVVITWAFSAEKDIPAIGFNNRHAMFELTQRVIEFGHSQIGVISGVLDGNDRAKDRLAGIKSAVEKNGLTLSPDQIIETPYGVKSGEAAFEKIMSLPTPPTAVICGNDVLAAGAIRKAQDMGLKVPEDISITGFDDIELASILVPGLTTVHVPHREMGRQAAKALVAMLQGNKDSLSEELDTHVVIRDSLGPPAQKE